MPEYLAPGVYVEEIDTGSKPIEGVSTSTSGMIGVTVFGLLLTPVFYVLVRKLALRRDPASTVSAQIPAPETH